MLEEADAGPVLGEARAGAGGGREAAAHLAVLTFDLSLAVSPVWEAPGQEAGGSCWGWRAQGGFRPRECCAGWAVLPEPRRTRLTSQKRRRPGAD